METLQCSKCGGSEKTSMRVSFDSLALRLPRSRTLDVSEEGVGLQDDITMSLGVM